MTSTTNKMFFVGLLFVFFTTIAGRAQNCNNWLKTANNSAVHDGVTIGNLGITGNQLTIEATFNSSDPTSVTGYNAALVSKHSQPADCNFVLRTDVAQLTTQSNGLVTIFSPCDYVANKTYHVAMVYDGKTLKFYRNGFLMISAPQSGNMVTNNWLTTIGNKAGGTTTEGLRGVMNEVRIWNVARTQSQIQTYMNTSLPNPTTQTGLLAYYTFDNLVNKQGNTAWNGTFIGSASINATNPNCNFVADSCSVPSTICSSWLSTSSQNSYVSLGDLDVSGNQITVEANINSTATNPGGRLYAGDIVSKHTDPSNTNYLLRPNSAEITTTNGYFITPVICNINLNQTYHVAFVYNGSTLKFYRDGFLMSQVNATGNLFQNNLDARIGLLDDITTMSEQFFGYINEVRIWNVARTQAQIQTYMNTSLPNPTTQNGLVAYYTFNSLLNKQGNTAWNGSLAGSSSINATNPNCSFVADSCSITATTCVNWKDSLRFNAVPTSCNNFNFNGLIYPSATVISSWQWAFGDGLTANNQNTTHIYSTVGSYTVKLIVTNAAGCSDSIFSSVKTNAVTADAGNDSTICHGVSLQLHGVATGGTIYAWSPAQYLNDSTLLNPVANITKDTKFYFSVKNSPLCATTDSVTIKVKSIPLFTINPGTSVCTNSFTQLSASGGNVYQWSPVTGLSNPSISNPIANPTQNTTYNVFIKESICSDTATLHTTVSVLPNPVISANSANNIDCATGQSQLIASGALQYIWAPSDGLSNPLIYNPIASPVTTTIYTVVGKDQNGCSDSSKVSVSVTQNGKSGYYMPSAFTPNGDGLNDCFGIKNWGQINTLNFIIYNRYGKKVFYTESPSGCWDGTFNGQPQPVGSYVYHIKAVTICGTADKTGSVILIR